MPVACTLCARACTRSPRTRARTHSARRPLSPAPLHCTRPRPPHSTSYSRTPCARRRSCVFRCVAERLAKQALMPGVARSVALCVLPAPTRADTSLRLGAVLQARLARVLRRQGLRVLRRHCLWRHRLRHRRRWHRLHRAAQPRPGRVQTERPPPSTAGHLTAAEHPVAGRFVYPNAMCSRSSLR